MPKDQRTLDQILQATADVLFPGESAPPRIALNTADVEGDTPLHVYLWRNDAWAARVLLEHGADPNAVGDMGETPLHVAVREASVETIAALLKAGAREDTVSEFGQTPAQLAKERGRASLYREAQWLARDARYRQG